MLKLEFLINADTQQIDVTEEKQLHPLVSSLCRRMYIQYIVYEIFKDVLTNVPRFQGISVFHVFHVGMLNISDSSASVICVCDNILQQTKEKVKLLIQLADSLVEKGHAHVLELKRWVSTVDRRYRDFSARMGKYQESLERSLGMSSEVKTATHTRVSAVPQTSGRNDVLCAGQQRPGTGHHPRQPD